MTNSLQATVVTIPFQKANGEIEHRTQLSLSETNKLTGVPVGQLRKLCRSGVLNPVTGFGRKWYLPVRQVTELLNQQLHQR